MYLFTVLLVGSLAYLPATTRGGSDTPPERDASFQLAPDTVDAYVEERREMVRTQVAARGVDDPQVLEAMRTVKRHRFVSASLIDAAYDDRPLPIGHGQTISQPFIVAYMTELAGVESDDHVLEVGTGSGYQAAVLAEIVDSVYTIEIVPELAASARARLADLGYDNVVVRHADGYHGWPEHAPYEAIIVTAASEHIPPPLIEQLGDGGRMVIPVGTPFRTQMLMLVTKEDGAVKTQSLTPVRFVPFTRSN